MNAVEVVTLRFPAGMRGDLMDIARSKGESMNGIVVEELRKAIKRNKSNPPKPKQNQ